MTFRMEQYREQLKQEGTRTREAIETMAALTHQAHGETAGAAAHAQEEEEGPLLYDLVFEKHEIKRDPNGGASKVSRDTLNPTHLSRQRAYGNQRTTSLIAFQPPPEHSKPEFANKPIIRDTFFRKTNVFFPQTMSGGNETSA